MSLQLLLNDELAPITREIGFLEADAATVADNWLRWRAEGRGTKNDIYHRKEIDGSLQEVLLSLTPLTQGRRRWVLIPTKSNWTACFDNSWKGGDATPYLRALTNKFKYRGLRMLAEPTTIRGANKEHGRWGGLIMTIYGPEKTDWLNVVRTLSLINEGGRWKFHQSGTPMPFEKLEQYQAKRTKERLTETLFREYLAALELHPFDEEFYLPPEKGPAILLEHQLLPSTVERTFTLQDVKQYV
jgi:hypothetical protein